MANNRVFNEASRVQIPGIIHLEKLGYKYLSLKNQNIDHDTNIFIDVFKENVKRVNPDASDDQIIEVFKELKRLLNYDDLGRAFYRRIVEQSGLRIIDFDNIENNQLNSVFELPFVNEEEEFRPDITILVNGIPLSFIEVKKPNNRTGIIAERNRLDARFKNKHFKKFINEFQFLVFSNNMEYAKNTIDPIEGAYYSTTSYSKASFQYFREQNESIYQELSDCEDDTENKILLDTNYPQIKNTPEYLTNKNPLSPTNKILSSLYNKKRFFFILNYGIAYVDSPEDGLQKQVMRYPQLFALLAIRNKLNENVKKGIIWHTQGSGKTALAFFAVKFLSNYYQQRGIIPKFYFITDRLDLMEQASNEFEYRGLKATTVNSKDDFVKSIKSNRAINNKAGSFEINVVNIQKFSEDSCATKSSDYDISVQRFYFLDEVHRSYNPTGSFLANLLSSDRNAVLIGLTGTPIIVKDYKSTDIFGPYIHTYYYNQSIADGYTLKLIREGIKKEYSAKLKDVFEKVKVTENTDNYKIITSHKSYVEPLVDYIVNDFNNSKIAYGDDTIGAMIVCDSSDQARAIFDCFNRRKTEKVALILNDVDDKETRRKEREAFKKGDIDYLIVYNMLLTGFDAHRLKKLYLGRKVYDHNLLQTLTRVNRPYKNFRYGYVVDFADITKEFDKVNEEYLHELQSELGIDFEHYRDMFKTDEEINEEIENIKNALFMYDSDNIENFSTQVSQINDYQEALKLKKALESSRELYNVIRSSGKDEFLSKLDFKKLSKMYDEVSRRVDIINFRNSIEMNVDSANLLNEALNNFVFSFRKYTEEELVIADQYQGSLSRVSDSLNHNFDKHDPKWVSLYDELSKLLRRKNLEEITQEDMAHNIEDLNRIYELSEQINRYNSLLKSKYDNDEKFARIHKALLIEGIFTNDRVIHDVLIRIKHNVDSAIVNNSSLLSNESFFNKQVSREVIDSLDQEPLDLPIGVIKSISRTVANEYLGGTY
jgi:type I restriction enzyme R subunit